MSKTQLVKLSGMFFILIGLLGFVMDPILGLFGVDAIHNVIHLVSGALALVMVGKGEDGAATYGKIMTVVYGLVTILGFITPMGFVHPQGHVLGFIEMNGADNWLHIALTALFAYIGFAGHTEKAKTV